MIKSIFSESFSTSSEKFFLNYSSEENSFVSKRTELYRYGFNGKENDPESNSTGSGTQDYGMRIYNPSLGRFLSVDPLTKSYPWNSTYAFCENRVIDGIDLEGLEYYYTADGTLIGKTGLSTEVRVLNADANVEQVQQQIGLINGLDQKMNYVEVNNGLNQTEQSSYNLTNDMLNNSSTSAGMSNAELNNRAFLTTIRQAENSSMDVVSEEPLGYNVNFGGGTFSDYSKHPNKTVTAYGATSSAAGAYQIMSKTWTSVCVPLAGFTDFTPQTQDQAALLLIDEQDKRNPRANGVTTNIATGNVLAAAHQLNGTWTSLPGGSQKKMTDAQFMQEFKENVANELKGKSSVATPPGELIQQ